MREFKFRAWNKQEKRMIGHDELERDYNLPYLLKHPVSESFSLTEYTGAKDVNGKEIYRNDIVTTDQKILHVSKYWQVIWQYMGYWLDNESDEWKDMESEYGDYINWQALTVVGNTYENPELLRGDAQ